MVALKQGSVPDVIANKLDHLLILTSGTEQYLITCTNKKYKFLLTTTLTISEPIFQIRPHNNPRSKYLSASHRIHQHSSCRSTDC